jgi:hypothetical protein
VPCLACLAACGGRSDLTAAIAGSGDAGTTKTASDGGAGAPGCHAWSVAPGGPVALTDPDLDSFGGTYASDRSASAAVEGSRVFVSTWDASGNIYPSPDQSWHVRVVADDLATMGPSQIVLHHGDEGGDAMALASGFGHRAGFGFDESKGCVFVPLADDGSAAGAPKTIAADECFWPRATPDGFTVFLIPDWVPFVLVTLDASGNVLAQEPGLGPPGGMVANARARIPDGSTLITWPSVAAAITARRWSAAGDALSPPEVFLSMPAVDAAPMTVVGGAVLVAWAPYSGDVGAVRVQPANEDGDPLGPPVTIAAADGVHVDSLDITTAGGGALAIWTKQEMGGSVTTVQPLTAEGLPEGAPIVLPTTPTVQSSYIVGTPAGAMIEFDGNQPGGHTQAFVTRLVCEE